MPTLTAYLRPVHEQILDVQDDYARSIALSHGDRQLSYRELNDKADQFARYLAQLGIVAGDTVAICMERSFDWIVAALGIMRAGAAYVPLDSAWPDSRLRFAVKDSGATVLVARAGLLDRLQVKARGVDPCCDAAAIAAAPGVAHRSIQPESLAYVIYTSGSTGVPKGVEITHANLAHLIRWHRDAFGVTQKIALVISQVLDLTRLSGKSGRILPREQPFAFLMMRCGHRRIDAAVDDSRACDDRFRSDRPRRAHDGDGAGRPRRHYVFCSPVETRCATLRRPRYPLTSLTTTDPPNARWWPHQPCSNLGHTGAAHRSSNHRRKCLSAE